MQISENLRLLPRPINLAPTVSFNRHACKDLLVPRGSFLSATENPPPFDDLVGQLAQIASCCLYKGHAAVGKMAAIGCINNDPFTLCFVQGGRDRDNWFRNKSALDSNWRQGNEHQVPINCRHVFGCLLRGS